MNTKTKMRRFYPNPTRLGSRGGFTLVELLVVLAIIVILAAIIIPVVGSVRSSARQSRCLANMRSVGQGFMLFVQDNNGYFPGHGPGAGIPNKGEQGKLRWSWRVGVYMDLSTPVIDVSPAPGVTAAVRNLASKQGIFHCASTDSSLYTKNDSIGHYGVNVRVCPSVGDSGGYANGDYGLLGVRANTISNPTTTVLMGDRFSGGGDREAQDEKVNIAATLSLDGIYPAKLNGLSANHRKDGNPAAGAGNTNILFCDGHVGVIGLETLAEWPGQLNFAP